jgi:hypothetical protein
MFMLTELNGEWDLYRIEHLLATQNARTTVATEMKVWALPESSSPKDLRRQRSGEVTFRLTN